MELSALQYRFRNDACCSDPKRGYKLVEWYEGSLLADEKGFKLYNLNEWFYHEPACRLFIGSSLKKTEVSIAFSDRRKTEVVDS